MRHRLSLSQAQQHLIETQELQSQITELEDKLADSRLEGTKIKNELVDQKTNFEIQLCDLQTKLNEVGLPQCSFILVALSSSVLFVHLLLLFLFMPFLFPFLYLFILLCSFILVVLSSPGFSLLPSASSFSLYPFSFSFFLSPSFSSPSSRSSSSSSSFLYKVVGFPLMAHSSFLKKK